MNCLKCFIPSSHQLFAAYRGLASSSHFNQTAESYFLQSLLIQCRFFADISITVEIKDSSTPFFEGKMNRGKSRRLLFFIIIYYHILSYIIIYYHSILHEAYNGKITWKLVPKSKSTVLLSLIGEYDSNHLCFFSQWATQLFKHCGYYSWGLVN